MEKFIINIMIISRQRNNIDSSPLSVLTQCFFIFFRQWCGYWYIFKFNFKSSSCAISLYLLL